MASNVKVCEVCDEAKELLKKFRFRKEKNTAAIILKVEKAKLMIVVQDELEDTSIEELKEELSETQPRFVVLSYVYKHDDGRVSYPLCFIYICPQGAHPEQSMMYAGSMSNLVVETGLTKVFELRSVEELTEEWLIKKLQFFR